ncbi:diguanylate cyclase [Glaciecola sp. MF2-115]|uniref:diguanylate cyclase n=1 Tax=Glaciecola sp. MF2-115 TaxID=3384827 RepID=UPI00399FD604
MKVNNRQTIRLFTYAQFAIVAVFSIVVLFSTIRLTEIGKILAELTNETVPKVSYAATLNTQIQNLATLTAVLANAQSKPARQLARESVQKSMQQINDTLLKNSTDSTFLFTRLNTLYKEIHELDELVLQRIIFQKQLENSKSRLNAEIQKLLTNTREINGPSNSESMLVEALLLSVKITEESRLHEIRQIEANLLEILERLKFQFDASEMNEQFNTKNIEALLFDPEGLINQKIQSLRIEGRTRGRDNFVRNLIADASSNLQYQAYVVNKTSIENARKSTLLTQQYSILTIAAGALAVLLALAIIYFLHKRIITRLMALSRQVRKAANSPDARITVEGNDEISELANMFSIYQERVKEQESTLLNMTLTDPLTGIPNRRAFESKLIETIDLALRSQSDVSVLMIDIDYFKAYNDHYGHSAGDACLRLVANELNKTLSRQTDFCGRFGGEEFVCILPNTDLAGAKAVAESLRKAIESLEIPHEKASTNSFVTVSIGAATSVFNKNTHLTKEILVLQADKALYRAKEKGRNTCCFFE